MSKRIVISIALIATLLCTVFIPVYSSVMTMVNTTETNSINEVVENTSGVMVASSEADTALNATHISAYKNEQYHTDMSAAYASRNTQEEYVNTQSGALTASQVDYSIPLTNGQFDLKRIYNSDAAVNDAHVANYAVEYENSFYRDAYHIGEGWRFSFPMIELVKKDNATDKEKLQGMDIVNMLYHSESGAVYSITPEFTNVNENTPTVTFTIANHALSDMKVEFEYSDYSESYMLNAIHITHINQGVRYTFKSDGKIFWISYASEMTGENYRQAVSFSHNAEGLLTSIHAYNRLDDEFASNAIYFDYIVLGENDTNKVISQVRFLKNWKNGEYDVIKYNHDSEEKGLLTEVVDIDGTVKNKYFYDTKTLQKYINKSLYNVTAYPLKGVLYTRNNKLSCYKYEVFQPNANQQSSRIKMTGHQDYTVTATDETFNDPGESAFKDITSLYGYKVESIGATTSYSCADDVGVIEYNTSNDNFIWETGYPENDYFIGSVDGYKKIKIKKASADESNVITVRVKPYLFSDCTVYVNDGLCTKTSEVDYEYEEHTFEITADKAQLVDEDAYLIEIYYPDTEIYSVTVTNVSKYIPSDEINIYTEQFGYYVNPDFWQENVVSDTSGRFNVYQNYMHSWRRMHCEMISQKSDYTDFELTTTIQFMGDPITDHTSAGVVFWVTDKGNGNNNFNGYYARISPGTDNEENKSTVGLFRMYANEVESYDGRAEQIAVEKITGLEIGEDTNSSKAYPMKVKAVGPIVEIYVIDMFKPVLTVDCSNYGHHEGAVGVRTFQRRAAYYSFRVTDGHYQRVASKTISAEDPKNPGETITTTISETYDFSNNLIEAQSVSGKYKTIKSYEYDQNRMPKLITTYEYEEMTDVETDASYELKSVKTETYLYDEQGNLLEYRSPLAKKVDEDINSSTEAEENEETDVTLTDGHVVQYEYDETWGMPTKKTVLKDDDTIIVTTYSLNDEKNLILDEETSENGNVIRSVDYVYNDANRIESKTVTENNESVTTTYEYVKNDEASYTVTETCGELETSKKINARNGNVISVTDANGNTTQYTYDAAERITAVADSIGVKNYKYQESRYCEEGSDESSVINDVITTYINEKGVETVTTYDAYGRAIKQIVQTVIESDATNEVSEEATEDSTEEPVEDPTDEVQYKTESETVMTYDERGNLISVKDAEGRITTYTYDELNRVLTESVGDYTTSYDYVTLNENGAAVFKKIITYGDGEGTTIIVYDVEGRELYTEDGLSNKTIAEYDYLNNKTAVTNANGRTTHFEYDGLGRLIKSTKANNDVTEYTYNVFDNVSTKTEGDTLIEYSYDGVGRVTKERYYSLDDTGDKLDSEYYYTEYTYDGNGNTLTLTKGKFANDKKAESERTAFTYDARNNVISKSVFVDATTAQVTTFKYDGCGNLIKQIEGIEYTVVNETETDVSEEELAEKTLEETEVVKGYTTEYTYDYANQVLSETITDDEGEVVASIMYVYDKTGLMEEKISGGNTESYVYDVAGNIIEKTMPNGLEISYTYDTRGNVLSESYQRGEDTILVAYEYDEVGRMTGKTDAMNNTTRYRYDNVGNLIKVIDPRYSESEEKYVQYEYDSKNRKVLTAIVENNKATTIETIDYDVVGNVVAVESGAITKTYEHDAIGNVTKETDGVGNTVEYTYDGSGRVLTHKDGVGNVATYDYYLNGIPENIEYADGTVTNYSLSDFDATGKYKVTTKDRLNNKVVTEYNAWGSPEKVTYYYATGSVTMPYGTGYVESYAYDNLGRKISFINREGTETRYTYDKAGNLLSEKVYDEDENLLAEQSFTYSKDALLLTAKDACENTVTYSYDKCGNVVLITYPEGNSDSFTYADGMLTQATKAGITTDYTYDALGRVLSESISDRVVTYTYDVAGNVVKATDAEGGTVQYVYDNAGRLVNEVISREDGQPDYGTYMYDANGRVIVEAYNTTPASSTRYTYDEMGNVTEKSVNNVTTTYTYDKLGRVLTETTDGCTAEYSYDDLGNMYAVKDANGNYTLYTYDIMGRVLTQADGISDENIATLSNVEDYKNGNTFVKAMAYEYDSLGNLTKETNALGNYNEYTYDACGRVLTVKTPDGETASTKTYDGNGNLVSDKDAKGNTAYYTYTNDRLMTVTDRSVNHIVIESYAYNEHGEVTSVTDAVGNITTYEYDNAGRLTNVAMPEGVTTTYTYDKAGNRLTQTDGNGNVTKYEYSAYGRLVSVTNADGNTESYEYDAFGNVTEKTDGNGTVVSYEYDKRNNLTNICYDGKIIAYSYDEMNNRISMDDESGLYAYTYDSGNRLVSVTKDNAAYLNYTYDKVGNVTSVNHLTYTYDDCSRMISANNVTYTYDENGNLATTTYPTGSVTYTYDANNHVTNVANSCNDDVLSYAYTYYNNGMEKSKDDGTKVVEYVYDGAGRLKTVTETPKNSEVTTRTATYTYDKAGNRISLVEVCSGTENINGEAVSYAKKTTEYLYSKANVITLESEIYQNAEDSELTRRNTRYVYDKAGNQTSKTIEFITNAVEGAEYDVNLGDSSVIEVTINEYNGLNQLVGSTNIKGGARTYASYAYNGDNLRVQKTVNNTTTDYVLTGGYVIAETESVTNNGEVEAVTNKTYLHGLSYHGYTSADATYWYFTNSHGGVTCVVDAAKATAAEYEYDEFGNITYQDGNIDNDVLYSGEFYDSESENYYLRARYYDPSIGRFTQQDTFLGVYDNPLSLNRYTYCHNNPIMFVDPSGHVEFIQRIGDVNVGYDSNQITSSEMDGEFGHNLYLAQTGQISAQEFINRSVNMGVYVYVTGAYVSNGEKYDNNSAEEVEIIFGEPLSYNESISAIGLMEEYNAGKLETGLLKERFNQYSAMSIKINETNYDIYYEGVYGKSDNPSAQLVNGLLVFPTKSLSPKEKLMQSLAKSVSDYASLPQIVGTLFCNSSQEALDEVLAYTPTIERIINNSDDYKGKISVAEVQAILFQEIRFLRHDDYLFDSAVIETNYYYDELEKRESWPWWKKLIVPLPELPTIQRLDSSTGVGQMFAQTAILTINWKNKDTAYDSKDRKDLYEVWYKIYSDDEYAIDLVAMHLLYLKNVTDSDGNYMYTTLPDVFARYNGTGDSAKKYGQVVYNYYLAFDSYNKEVQ